MSSTGYAPTGTVRDSGPAQVQTPSSEPHFLPGSRPGQTWCWPSSACVRNRPSERVRAKQIGERPKLEPVSCSGCRGGCASTADRSKYWGTGCNSSSSISHRNLTKPERQNPCTIDRNSYSGRTTRVARQVQQAVDRLNARGVSQHLKVARSVAGIGVTDCAAEGHRNRVR